MNFYVYGYTDRKSNDPFMYIGKGTGDRYLEHFNACLKYKSSFYNKLRGILLEGRCEDVIVTKLKSGMTESEAYDYEIEQIEKYGRLDLGTGCLHNRTAGGDGFYEPWTTEDKRVALSKRMTKYFEDPIERERASKKAIILNGRPVQAFDLKTGITVLSFACIRDISKKGFNRSSVQQVLRGKRPYADGYGWRYAE